MTIFRNAWATFGPTSLFVLLWGSGAIFSRWGLDHSSAFAILTLRFGLALLALLFVAALRRRLLPRPGTGWQVALTGLALIGGYSICYFLALENGITPGVLATVLGVQPILTLLIVERGFSLSRLAGLVLALCGLALVVFQGLLKAHFSPTGVAFALLALACMTSGAILQKRIRQAPQDVLPLQYLVSLVLCLLFVPFKPFAVEWVAGFVIPLLWLGLVISVGAQLLLYRLIQAGNLVNVTSLFYLVPVVTAVMDYLFLGNALSMLGVAGMAAILLGLAMVFRPGRRT
ncbi:DMT family transporter [Pseudomonas jinjuensis]|uniref:Threonine/homoserine efflux transporter RhtA n=1 Tax=Pseudomonas jinjuensis TaxID=198616 RepID=A0A1H0D5V6_9PSED|nr:DMT family transporter [Pseudomonas jinjuensis]SDN65455.1 Threonine/homoserine efflux transporter RhtA [Pseudomonas jinjuensis]